MVLIRLIISAQIILVITCICKHVTTCSAQLGFCLRLLHVCCQSGSKLLQIYSSIHITYDVHSTRPVERQKVVYHTLQVMCLPSQSCPVLYDTHAHVISHAS